MGVVPGKPEVAVAEINLDALDLGEKQIAAKRVSKYQKNTLDFTFETDKTYGEVEGVFEKFKHPLNMGFRLKDVFERDGVFRYTIEFTVGSYEKTLTAEDINDVWQKVIAAGRAAGFVIKE